MQSYSRGVLFCVIATMSWGAMFPVMTGALLKIDPFTFTCMRYTIAGLAFLALLLVKEGRPGVSLKGERVWLAWFFGTAGFAGFGFLVFLGQQLAGKEGALTASIMMATQPMLGLLVNWVLRKVVPPVFSFLFILLSFCGVTLVITKGHVMNLVNAPQYYGADGLIVLGALCWVLYTVGAAFFPKWSPYKYTTVTTLLGLTSVFAITAVLLVCNVIPLPSPGTVLAVAPHLAYMAFGAGLIGVLCWNFGNKILTPLNGVLFMDVVPVTAFAISASQGLVLTGAQLLGASLTALALIFNNVYLRRRQMRQQQTTTPRMVAPAPAR